MKKITIAFKKVNKDSGLLSKAIGWKQGVKYSHVEMGFKYEDDDRTYKSLVAIYNNGVLIYEDRFYNTRNWDIMELTVTDEQYKRAQKICDGYIGLKYDVLGIFGFLVPVKDRSDRWFCSEAVSNTLKCIGFEPMTYIEPSDVGIKKLLKIVDFENNKIER